MNVNKLMKQMKQMQEGLQTAQAELETKEVEVSLAGDKLKVVATGAGDIVSITIDPALVDPDDTEFLQETVLAGVQQAIAKGKELASKEMGALTGGLGGLPGMG